MVTTTPLFNISEKKMGNQLLMDIAQACLKSTFVSDNPKLFVHIDHSHIEIHIRKDALLDDHILRETSIDAGLLIFAIRSMMIHLHYEPIADYELIEKGTIRVARIALGTPIESERLNHLTYYENSNYPVEHANVHISREDQIIHEMQHILIEKLLYIQRNNSKINSGNQPEFVIIGSYFHLGGWIEVGMKIGKAIELVNKKLKTKLTVCSASKSAHEMPQQDRNRGRTVLAGISLLTHTNTITDREIMDYFV